MYTNFKFLISNLSMKQNLLFLWYENVLYRCSGTWELENIWLYKINRTNFIELKILSVERNVLFFLSLNIFSGRKSGPIKC